MGNLPISRIRIKYILCNAVINTMPVETNMQYVSLHEITNKNFGLFFKYCKNTPGGEVFVDSLGRKYAKHPREGLNWVMRQPIKRNKGIPQPPRPFPQGGDRIVSSKDKTYTVEHIKLNNNLSDCYRATSTVTAVIGLRENFKRPPPSPKNNPHKKLYMFAQ